MANLPDIELARLLYMWSQGKPDVEYDGWTTHGASFSDEKLYLTAKTNLYFYERHAQRIERTFVVTVAILAALAAAKFGNVI